MCINKMSIIFLDNVFSRLKIILILVEDDHSSALSEVSNSKSSKLRLEPAKDADEKAMADSSVRTPEFKAPKQRKRNLLLKTVQKTPANFKTYGEVNADY